MADEQPRKQAAFLRWMGPILDALRELGGSGTPKQVEDSVARAHGVTDAERQVLTKTGQSVFANQVAWGRQYLIYEELLVCPKRGIWKLTESGERTKLAIDDAALIAKKWVKHHTELRKQRAADQQQGEPASYTGDSGAEDPSPTKTEFIRWMGPILDALRELGGSGTPKQVEEALARTSDITDTNLQTILKSGQTRFYNQFNFAKLYLRYEGLIVCPKSGIWKLTESGQRTTLSMTDAAIVLRKWRKHHTEVRKQRTFDKQQDDPMDDTFELNAEQQPLKHATRTLWMGQILDALRELGGSGTPKKVYDWIARANGFANARELIKAGEIDFQKQVSWGRQYLVYEGLLLDPQLGGQKRGIWTLTEIGQRTKLSNDDSAAIYKKWLKHKSDLRKQRTTGDTGESLLTQLEDAQPAEVKLPRLPYDLAACARETNFTIETLARWIKAIERKQQAVLYGPPGTGKTFVAERLAKHLADDDEGFYEVIQFHPAYSYEEFVQGIRPRTRADGHLEYAVLPGRFIDFCRRAKQCKGRCVLIVDEINRANLSRVFGELMYLLEYRDREIPLAAGGRFQIPSNVRILGTMNTADRSIALVDHALRRRFAFLALRPDYDILRQFHQATGFDPTSLIELLQKVNRLIGDRHYELGISFFLRTDIRDQLEDIWQMEIEPYLEEVFFDQEGKLDDLRWDRVSGGLVP